MNKKAFTLIEVLVAVVILSTVAVMLFEISTNSKNNYAFLSSKANFTTLASIPLMHNNQKFQNSEKSLFAYLRNDYDIKDDELRKYLKGKKVHYNQEEFSKISLLDEGESLDQIPEDEKDKMTNMNFKIIFTKIQLNSKKQSTFAYQVEITQ